MRNSTFRITNKIIKEILVFDSIHCSYLRVLFLLYENGVMMILQLKID